MPLKAKLWLLFLVGFLLYLPSFWNHFLWDDEQFIYRNVYVKEFRVEKFFTENTIAGAGEVSNYYRPLTTLSLAIDYAVWGLHPFGFHLTNTLLHSLSGVLLYLLLKRLTLFSSSKIDFPFLVSLLFLIHPIQTEAVTYMNSRGDSMYVFFTLLGLLSFHHLRTFKPTAAHLQLAGITFELPSTMRYVLPPLFYLLSILSKEIALASLGLYFLIYGYEYLRQTHRPILTHFWLLLSLTTIGLSYFGLRLTVLNFENTLNFHPGTNIYTDSLVIRLVTFAHILWEYFRLLIIPYPLHMERGDTIYTNVLSSAVGGLIVLLGLIVAAMVWEWRRYHSLTLFFGTAWFFIMIALVSGIVPVNGLMYEHWLYLPMVGFWLVIFRLYQLLTTQCVPQKFQSLADRSLIAFQAGMVCIFMLLTLRQNYIWRHPIPFYEYTLQFTDSPRVHNNLAMAYSEAGREEDAIREYLKAMESSDAYPQVHYNVANSYLALNRYEEAEQEYLHALAIDPNFYLANQELLDLYLFQKRYQEAEVQLNILLELAPNHPTLLQIQRDLNQKLQTP